MTELDNESWIIEYGDDIIAKKCESSIDDLCSVEHLVYLFWVLDYSVRNAGDLDAGEDLCGGYLERGRGLSGDLECRTTHEIFNCNQSNCESVFYDKFNAACSELRLLTITSSLGECDE